MCAVCGSSPPARPPAAAMKRYDLISFPQLASRCGLVLTHFDGRCSAISLVNDSGECFEPLTTTRYGRNTMPITKLKLAPITH